MPIQRAPPAQHSLERLPNFRYSEFSGHLHLFLDEREDIGIISMIGQVLLHFRDANVDQLREIVLGREDQDLLHIKRVAQRACVEEPEHGFETFNVGIGDLDAVGLRLDHAGSEHVFEELGMLCLVYNVPMGSNE